ncbi:MAG: hypothetical protein C0P75_010710 [Bacilli bacterium]
MANMFGDLAIILAQLAIISPNAAIIRFCRSVFVPLAIMFLYSAIILARLAIISPNAAIIGSSQVL